MKFNSSALKSSARAVLLLLATHRVARCIRKICGPPVGLSVVRSKARSSPRGRVKEKRDGRMERQRQASCVRRLAEKRRLLVAWRGVAWPGALA
uniref:Putative secreted protein n=1 Tax=Anopheles triannulatus TaxID=58253 RepID=A0A2M4B4Y8_9DIPT